MSNATDKVIARHLIRQAAKKAEARKLAAAARKSERQAQADAIAMSECMGGAR